MRGVKNMGNKETVFEIAQSKSEARSLARDGYGYETREEAEHALADPKMDNFYRKNLKVFVVPRTK